MRIVCITYNCTYTQDEWELYKEIRENCSFKTTWFEVVGNHDTMMQFVRFLPIPILTEFSPFSLMFPCFGG